MTLVRLTLSTLAVVLISLAVSFGLLYVLSGTSTLSLGDDHQIDLSSSATVRLWAMLLGLSAGGFSVGPMLAPENQAIENLFASFGGDWFLLVTAALVLIGLAGGLFTKHPLRGALASGLAPLILTFVGVLLTATELPSLASVLDLPPGHLSHLVSAVELAQLAGGFFAALITSVMGVLGGRALQYREKVPIDIVKPPRITPVQPAEVDETEARSDAIAKDTMEDTQPRMDLSKSAELEVGVEDEVKPSPSVLDEGAEGPLARAPSCPGCGTRLTWIARERRYYCRVCATYP